MQKVGEGEGAGTFSSPNLHVLYPVYLVVGSREVVSRWRWGGNLQLLTCLIPVPAPTNLVLAYARLRLLRGTFRMRILLVKGEEGPFGLFPP